MAIIHEFDPQIYPRLLWVMIGGAEKDISERFTHPDHSEIDFSGYVGHNNAICFQARNRDSGLLGEFIWFIQRRYCVAPTMAHEAVHAALDICDDVGVEVNADNQEPFAYLVGWITREIYIAHKHQAKV